MTYHCERCKAVLPGGSVACPSCGKAFDRPVPADAGAPDAPFADLLRGRTAAGLPRPEPPPTAPSISPKRDRRWAWVLGGAALVALLALMVWAVITLWTLGPGGETAFRQHNLAGNAAVERGDYPTADAEYGQMIALRPRRVDGYLLRGISETKEGLYTASIADDTDALALVREPMAQGDLLHNRGEARADRGDLTGAMADLAESNERYALVRDPRLRSMVPERREYNDRDLAESHWQHKDYALAIADGDATIAIGHPRPTDYGLRGKAKAALGRDDAAASDFEQALRLDPSYLIAYTALAHIAERKHRPDQAVAVYERGARAEPTDAEIWGNLGWFQYKAGQTAAAVATDRHAEALDPNQVFVAYNLGLAYASAGMAAQARAAYADALSRGRDSDRSAGLADLRAALARQPGSLALRQALAQVAHGVDAQDAGSLAHPGNSRVAATPAPRPPAALASTLGPEVPLGDYGIQPPVGYTLTRSPEETLSSHGTDYVWAGPARADGTTPTLEVVIAEDGGRLAAHETSRQVTQEAVQDKGVNHTRLTTTPVTDCRVNGLPFVRGDWAGVGAITGKTYQGSEYWLVSPSHILHIASHDTASDSSTTTPLLRASILTFRRL